jgi:hypothetical protein
VRAEVTGFPWRTGPRAIAKWSGHLPFLLPCSIRSRMMWRMQHRLNAALPLGPLLVGLVILSTGTRLAAEGAETGQRRLLYEEPRQLTGGVYASEEPGAKLLFKFTRTATRSGTTVKVQRDFTYPDGKLAARELITYEGDALAAFSLEEAQIGAGGSAKVHHSGGNPGKATVEFSYVKEPGAKAKVRSETLAENTLNSDMVATFLARNWERLMRGEKLKSRYIVVPRSETVGFTFSKASEVDWRGRKAVVIKMEATSPIIAVLVDPLFFTIETSAPHRVLQYAGRTTPKIDAGGKWKDLDAVTVFDWESSN